MNSQPFGQALADSDGRLIQVDRVLCGMLGYDARALLQRRIDDITHPDDWPDNRRKLDALRRAEEPFTIVKRYLRADGQVVWVQNYVSLLRDAEGRPTLSALIRPVLPAIAEAQRWSGERPIPLGQSELRRLMAPRPGPGGILH